jgi:hypothetical protein
MQLRLLIGTCAAAALLSAAACSNDNASRTNTTPATPAATSDAKGTSGDVDSQPKPISLTGCLQRGDGHNYILTELSEPSAGAGASDVKGDGSKVEKEQVNAAEHAYRLNAAKNVNDDDWDKLVGKKVKVDGTLAKRSDIADNDRVGTSGDKDKDKDKDANDRDRVKIHEGDLAQVDVSSLQQVANACGGGNASKPRMK